MPVLVAQHMPASFTPLLARRLEQRSVLRIHEAADGEPLLPGTVLVAPGDRHLEVDETAAVARLSQEPPENSCRPSVDVLFRSVARALGPRALGLVLTGMGRDGLEGARFLRQAGGEVWVQDETSSVVWGMPGLIHQARLATRVGDLDTLADGLLERARLYRLGSGTTEHARNT
jgi:two-component system chemotaxis response regulator CheB